MSTPKTTTVRTVPAMLLAGVAAFALAVAVLLSAPGGATAEEAQSDVPAPAGPMQERAHRHADQDPQVRAEHLAELAETLGVDADELADVMAALRTDLDAQRAQMREDMAGLDRDERRAAMSAQAEQRRGLMAEALVELGVDPALLAEHHAENEHGERPQRQQHGAHRMAGPR